MNGLSHIMGMNRECVLGRREYFLDSQSFFIGYPGLADMFQTAICRT